jgi:hypothetical protein
LTYCNGCLMDALEGVAEARSLIPFCVWWPAFFFLSGRICMWQCVDSISVHLGCAYIAWKAVYYSMTEGRFGNQEEANRIPIHHNFRLLTYSLHVGLWIGCYTTAINSCSVRMAREASCMAVLHMPYR